MGQVGTDRRGPDARRDHQGQANQRDIAQRQRRQHGRDQPHLRPAGIDVAQRARDRDQHAEPRGRRDGLVDRTAIEGHEQVRELTAANAHQRGQEADDQSEDLHQRAAGQVGSQPPAVPAEQQPDGAEAGDDDEHRLEQLWRRIAGDEAAGDDAQHHGHGPGLQDREVDGPLGLVRPERSDGCRHDDRQRGADRQRHAGFLRDALQAEQLVQHRHDHGAASHAEDAGQQAGDGAGGQKANDEKHEVARGKAASHGRAFQERAGKRAARVGRSASLGAFRPARQGLGLAITAWLSPRPCHLGRAG